MPRGALLPVHADQGGVLQLRGQQDHGPVRQGEVDKAAQMQGEVRQPARLPSRGEGVAQLSLWRMPSVQAGGRAFQINFIPLLTMINDRELREFDKSFES